MKKLFFIGFLAGIFGFFVLSQSQARERKDSNHHQRTIPRFDKRNFNNRQSPRQPQQRNFTRHNQRFHHGPNYYLPERRKYSPPCYFDYKWRHPRGPRYYRGPGWRWDGFFWIKVILPLRPGPHWCWDYYWGEWVPCWHLRYPPWW